jgi:uncharacterized protein (TIGR02453 family)
MDEVRSAGMNRRKRDLKCGLVENRTAGSFIAWQPQTRAPLVTTKTATRTAHFSPALFEFFAELKQNNNKTWFTENKARYQSDVVGPMQRFIVDLAKRLPKISKHVSADPRAVGGSMFRIYRDTRFSKDKSPYKTAVAAHFQHSDRKKDHGVPGFYLHLSPEHCVGGGGIYQPDPESLKKIRERIVAKPREWRTILDSGIEIEGEALKRPPAGFDPEHPLIDDVKRKDYYAMTRFTQRDVCSKDFLDSYVSACAHTAPLCRFVAKALDLAW